MNFLRVIAKKMGLFKELEHKHNLLVSSMIIALQHDKEAFAALSQCFFTTKSTKNTANLLRYLELFRPFVSPKLELVRVGGRGDGGYSMLSTKCVVDLMENAGISSDLAQNAVTCHFEHEKQKIQNKSSKQINLAQNAATPSLQKSTSLNLAEISKNSNANFSNSSLNSTNLGSNSHANSTPPPPARYK